MGVILEAFNLWKVYPMGESEVSALCDVSLQINRGEILAITGPSGSGKTTLLNCLSTLDTVSRGEIYFEGKDIANLFDRERTKLRGERMGFIFQQYQLIPVLTAVENVELPLLLLDIPADEARTGHLNPFQFSVFLTVQSINHQNFPVANNKELL